MQFPKIFFLRYAHLCEKRWLVAEEHFKLVHVLSLKKSASEHETEF
jgi:hypothetical protein